MKAVIEITFDLDDDEKAQAALRAIEDIKYFFNDWADDHIWPYENSHFIGRIEK